MAIRGQGRMERRRGERRTRRFTPRMWLIMGGVLLGFVGLLGVLIASSGDGDEAEGRFPQVGDHRHANYAVSLCGEGEPPFPASGGGVHTHGNGLIHIHPTNASAAGPNANLARFISTTGSRLTDNSLELPSGMKYTGGDECPDGQTGQMFLRVNGITMPDIAGYVPRDGDDIELGFEAQ